MNTQEFFQEKIQDLQEIATALENALKNKNSEEVLRLSQILINRSDYRRDDQEVIDYAGEGWLSTLQAWRKQHIALLRQAEQAVTLNEVLDLGPANRPLTPEESARSYAYPFREIQFWCTGLVEDMELLGMDSNNVSDCIQVLDSWINTLPEHPSFKHRFDSQVTGDKRYGDLSMLWNRLVFLSGMLERLLEHSIREGDRTDEAKPSITMLSLLTSVKFLMGQIDFERIQIRRETPWVD